MARKIAVLGGGNGAHAMAADLSCGGFEVHLCEMPEFKQNIEQLMKQNNEIEISGVPSAWRNDTRVVRVKNVTTDIEEAIEGAELINVVVPAFGHEPFYKAMAPHLEDGQIVVSHPGNYGTFVLANLLKKLGIKKDVIMADTATLVYTCRRIAATKIKLNGFKGIVRLAALPAKGTPKVLEIMDQVIPGHFKPGKNALEVGLENLNPQFHVPIMVLNAGRVEDTKGKFLLYIEGATPSVSRIIEKMCEEKKAVARILELSPADPKNALREMYGAQGETLYEAFQNTKQYWDRDNESAPATLSYRYISEDVPFGLVAIEAFGKVLKVPTPLTTLFIDLSSELNQTDYRKQGLTVENLGLGEMNAEQIVEILA